jgi:hypothetical protein
MRIPYAVHNYTDKNWGATSHNTAYTLRANALALRDIAPFGRNVVYAENVIRNCRGVMKKGA